ncbi:T9SS type A sorting domain-containing protein [Segatella hominis]
MVSVYDLQGRKIKKVAASTNIWAGLMSSLPSGTYILKSASKSIKFKN